MNATMDAVALLRVLAGNVDAFHFHVVEEPRAVGEFGYVSGGPQTLVHNENLCTNALLVVCPNVGRRRRTARKLSAAGDFVACGPALVPNSQVVCPQGFTATVRDRRPKSDQMAYTNSKATKALRGNDLRRLRGQE